MKMGVRRFCFLVVFVALPTITHAQVVVSEIMYDLPTGSDSGREWVELFNSDPASATLSEWKLFEGGVNHGITAYSGGETLASGAYAVVADNPLKFLEDWPTFSGLLFDSAFSLSNAGETLILRCCGSDLVDKDSATYSSESGASGDGNTLQRTSVSGSISSALLPTPGSGPLTASSEQNSSAASSTSSNSQTSTTTSATTSVTVSAPVSSYVTPPEIQIFADGGDDRTVIVGADTEFYGRAYNREKEELDRVRFMWNFGDGSTAEGPVVLHHFDYPGRYAVVLNIAEHRSASSDVIAIEAEPAQLSFGINADGSVSIGNGAGRELDLSRWIVRSFGREFILPDYSIILKSSAMHIIQKTLGFPAGLQTELLYPNGVLALRAGEGSPAAAPPAPPVGAVAPPAVFRAPAPARTLPSVQPVSPSKDTDEAENTGEENAEEQMRGGSASAEVAAAGATFDGSWKWLLAAFGLVLLGSGAAVLARRSGKHEWNIIEESPK